MSTISTTRADQRHLALERSKQVRSARAELKRRIEAGDVFAASILLDPPAEAQTWTVADLLVSQRRWGINRMRKLLGRLGIPEYAELAGPPIQHDGRRALTDRQRLVLARALGWQEEER